MNIDISQIGYRWKGIYSPNLAYADNDVVYKDGGAYVIRNGAPVAFALGQQDAIMRGHLLTGGLSAGGFGNMVLHTDGATVEFRYQDTRPGTRATKLFYSRQPGASTGSHYSGQAIMQDRSVRAWGNQNLGALGMGDVDIGRTSPGKVPFPPGTPHITDIVTCWNDTFYLDAAGGVWHCGNNEYSLGGYGTTTNQPIPRKVNGNGDLGANTKIVKIVAARGYYDSRSAMFLDDAGRVYATGSASSNKLGLQTTSDVTTPTLIPITETVPMKDMFIGAGTAGATWLLSTTGQLYAAGDYLSSGLAGDTDIPVHRLWMPWGEDKPVKSVVFNETDQHWVTGSQYIQMTTLVLENGDVYMWGDSGAQVGGGWGTGYVGAVQADDSALHPYKVNEGVKQAHSYNGGYHRSLCLMDDGTIQHSGYAGTEIAPGPVTTWTTIWPEELKNGTDLFMVGAQYASQAGLLRSDGTLVLWGDCNNGRAGVGITDGDSPASNGPVMLDRTIVDFQPMGAFTPDSTTGAWAMLTSDGGVYVTGSAYFGMNGDDDNEHSAVPRQIIF